MAEAPYVPTATLWQAYADAKIIPGSVPDRQGRRGRNRTVDSVKQVLASRSAPFYGTSLFTDWGAYQGDPVPYWGNGEILINQKTGNPAGHCMLIVGYDDTLGAIGCRTAKGHRLGQLAVTCGSRIPLSSFLRRGKLSTWKIRLRAGWGDGRDARRLCCAHGIIARRAAPERACAARSFVRATARNPLALSRLHRALRLLR